MEIDDVYYITNDTLFLFPEKTRHWIRMKGPIVISIFHLLFSAARCCDSKCISYKFNNPFPGRYCPKGSVNNLNLSWHQCKQFCLQSYSCQAVNYNFTDNLCSYFSETCTIAISSPYMAFVLFTKKRPEQCIEWIPIQDRHPQTDRSATEDNVRFVTRLQKDGNDYVGYWRTDWTECKSRDDRGPINLMHLLCQYLRIRDGCTIYYVGYERGAPMPPNAVIGGHIAGGLPVYIGRQMPPSNAVGYYILGSKEFVTPWSYSTGKVKIMVTLWNQLIIYIGYCPALMPFIMHGYL